MGKYTKPSWSISLLTENILAAKALGNLYRHKYPKLSGNGENIMPVLVLQNISPRLLSSFNKRTANCCPIGERKMGTKYHLNNCLFSTW